jgi:ribose 5-phosphate isomerase A
VALVEDGMAVGLGTGSTAAHAIRALGARVRAGLRIRAIATSLASEQLARSEAIPLADFTTILRLDLTIDGADEIDPQMRLVKGAGGALLREKIVARASERLVVVADPSKLVPRLGRGPLPVEVVPFGWQATARLLRALGAEPVLRGGEEHPFLSDGGHHILDCRFPGGYDPDALAGALDAVVGVVEHGLFIGYAERIVMA